MTKYLLLTILSCLTIATAQSQSTQNSKSSFDINNLTFGGGFGLQFGDYTAINISPQIGYNFSQYINAGAGFSYSYYREKYDHDNLKRNNHYLGFNVYSRIYPVPYLVLMVQPEMDRMWRTDKISSTGQTFKDEKFIPVCLVGGGLRLGSVTAMIQYDVAQNKYSPYGNNVFYSIGYSFGF